MRNSFTFLFLDTANVGRYKLKTSNWFVIENK